MQRISVIIINILTMEDFEKKMEDLKTPQINPEPPLELKLAIINADRSATLGLWFIVVPYFFFACLVMKYELQINLGLLDIITNAIQSTDKNPSLWWLQPLFLVGLPITGIIINILSITHFKWEKATSLLSVSIKLKWYNILVVLASLSVVGFLALYLVVENFQARPGH